MVSESWGDKVSSTVRTCKSHQVGSLHGRGQPFKHFSTTGFLLASSDVVLTLKDLEVPWGRGDRLLYLQGAQKHTTEAVVGNAKDTSAPTHGPADLPQLSDTPHPSPGPTPARPIMTDRKRVKSLSAFGSRVWGMLCKALKCATQ